MNYQKIPIEENEKSQWYILDKDGNIYYNENNYFPISFESTEKNANGQLTVISQINDYGDTEEVIFKPIMRIKDFKKFIDAFKDFS